MRDGKCPPVCWNDFLFFYVYNMLSLKNEINFKAILRTSFVGNYYNNSNAHKIKIKLKQQIKN